MIPKASLTEINRVQVFHNKTVVENAYLERFLPIESLSTLYGLLPWDGGATTFMFRSINRIQ